MRYPASEKLEIIRLVEWYDRYQALGEAGLEDRKPHPGRVWNRSRTASDEPSWTSPWRSRSSHHGNWPCAFTDTIKHFVSEACRVPHPQGARPDRQPRLHHHQGGGRIPQQDHGAEPALADRLHAPEGRRLGLVLSLHDPGRLQPRRGRLEALLHDAGRGRHADPGTGIEGVRLRWRGIRHRPRLLSDNGSSYISGNLAKWFQNEGIAHVRGAPNHPQTQGKIERWHQTLKNRILLENHYLPGALETAIGDFVDHYNHRRCHESLYNVNPTPTSVVLRPSLPSAAGSRTTPSGSAACSTSSAPPNLNPRARALQFLLPSYVPDYLTMDTPETWTFGPTAAAERSTRQV